MRKNRKTRRTIGAFCGALALGVAALTAAFGAEPVESAASTLGARIEALPFVPAGPVQPVEGFDAFGGDWKVVDGKSVEKAGGAFVFGRGDSGSRLTFAESAWATAKRGEIELSVRFPEAKAGFSGLCFKISDSGVGADASFCLVGQNVKIVKKSRRSLAQTGAD